MYRTNECKSYNWRLIRLKPHLHPPSVQIKTLATLLTQRFFLATNYGSEMMVMSKLYARGPQ
uniref:Uncharacterized protein n=1 Tax=Lotus japonicus TaxID=34305 RepID=I3SQL9_LOTJA|nr:unknown [Lotus japonicus]